MNGSGTARTALSPNITEHRPAAEVEDQPTLKKVHGRDARLGVVADLVFAATAAGPARYTHACILGCSAPEHEEPRAVPRKPGQRS